MATVKGLVWRRSEVKGRHLARAAGTRAWGAGELVLALMLWYQGGDTITKRQRGPLYHCVDTSTVNGNNHNRSYLQNGQFDL